MSTYFIVTYLSNLSSCFPVSLKPFFCRMKVIDEKPEDEEEEKDSGSKCKTPSSCTKKRVREKEEDLPPICHGWLIVCGKCISYFHLQNSLSCLCSDTFLTSSNFQLLLYIFFIIL